MYILCVYVFVLCVCVLDSVIFLQKVLCNNLYLKRTDPYSL